MIPVFKSGLEVNKYLFDKEDLEYLKNVYGDISIQEKIWLYQNNLSEYPKCLYNDCNNPVKFIKFSRGYQKYCCKKCSALNTNQDILIKEKRLKGIEKCNLDKDIRKEMTFKMKETIKCFDKDKKNDINKKRSKTVLKIYGIDNISKLKRKNYKKQNQRKKKLICSIRD